MTEALPTAVERWLEALGEPTEPFTTAVLQGRARFRREGKGLWLPIEAVMWHELGQHHVADLRVGLGPLTFIRGLDGYVDGVGFSRISHTLDVGPEIDQSAALFMWAEAVLFPSAWRDRDDVDWAAVDDQTVDVSLPFGEGSSLRPRDLRAPVQLPGPLQRPTPQGRRQPRRGVVRRLWRMAPHRGRGGPAEPRIGDLGRRAGTMVPALDPTRQPWRRRGPGDGPGASPAG